MFRPFFLGDCKNFIHLWEPTSDSTWNIDPKPFVGHTASVEDLQVCINLVEFFFMLLKFYFVYFLTFSDL